VGPIDVSLGVHPSLLEGMQLPGSPLRDEPDFVPGQLLSDPPPEAEPSDLPSNAPSEQNANSPFDQNPSMEIGDRPEAKETYESEHKGPAQIQAKGEQGHDCTVIILEVNIVFYAQSPSRLL